MYASLVDKAQFGWCLFTHKVVIIYEALLQVVSMKINADTYELTTLF